MEPKNQDKYPNEVLITLQLRTKEAIIEFSILYINAVSDI